MWHALAVNIQHDEPGGFCERMMFPPAMTRSLRSAAALLHAPGALADAGATTMQVVKRVEAVPREAVWCVWRLTADPLVRARLQEFLTRWPDTRPLGSGHDLQAAGLRPGPAIGRILMQLRVAWYEGSISSAEEEQALMRELVARELRTGRRDESTRVG